MRIRQLMGLGLVAVVALALCAFGAGVFDPFLQAVGMFGLPMALLLHTPLGLLPELGAETAGAVLTRWAMLATCTIVLAFGAARLLRPVAR